jgi:glycosyltransferase involved in cell wall biosynthesis
MTKVSVIIATRNRCNNLKDALTSILDQECDGILDYEILVVDNDSKDKTKEVVESYFQKFNGKLRYLFEPKHGKSYALNAAIKLAKGEILAFTDDDVIVDGQWLLNIDKCFRDYNCDAMGGKVLPLYEVNIPRWIKDNHIVLQGLVGFHDYGEEIKIYEKYKMFPMLGANMAVKKSCFNDIGYFRTDIGEGKGTKGEETELFWRLEKSGKNIYYCGRSIVRHKVVRERANLRYIAKWYIALGRLRELSGERKTKLICYFGFPRYLIRYILKDSIVLICSIFNRKYFIKNWINIFYNIGLALEYRKKYIWIKSA